MKTQLIYKLIIYITAAIWLVNGLVCKILNLEPRHQQIVARFFGDEAAPLLTKVIGVAEIIMCLWILSGLQRKWNVIVQIAVILTMNLLEFFFARDLLLWGKWNLVFASLLVLVLYLNEFYIRKMKK